MALLQVFGITRKEDGRSVLKAVSFTQQPFQKIAVAGATGSGKTTLLKIIAGLAQADAGQVFFDGARVYGPHEKLIPGHPGMAYLSQHFELLNHYRVAEVLEMANRLTEKEAALIYTICRVDHLLKRWTHQVSGGERQRIALARLLVSAPKLLLLDEPYSNLDAIHKEELKIVLQNISEQLHTTCILVSHDPVDVLSWADTILVLEAGRIVQTGAPEYVYQYPVNEYTAALFGKYNLLNPDLVRLFAVFKKGSKQIPHFIRPEDFKLASEAGEGLKATVLNVNFKGPYFQLEVAVEGTKITIYNKEPYEKGTAVYVSLF